MPAFLQEAGGSVSASIFSAAGFFSICFRLLHFLSEEISAFLRMISCPALLILNQELAREEQTFKKWKLFIQWHFRQRTEALNTVVFGSAEVAKVAASVPGCVFLRNISLCLWYMLFANILGTYLLMQSLGIKGLQPLFLSPINFAYFKARRVIMSVSLAAYS